MADFFDRLIAKAVPVPQAADSDGVKSVAAQPRLPHPFERPATVADLEWIDAPPAESELSGGNAMEPRTEPTSGGQASAPARSRSDDHDFHRPQASSRLSGDPGLRPLIVSPGVAETPLPRLTAPAIPMAAAQNPSRLTPPHPSSDSAAIAKPGTPTDRARAATLPSRTALSPTPSPASPSQARLAERGAPPAHRAVSAPQQPSVTVRIGRLEVRAATPPPAGPASRPDRRTREPALKLDEYLAREGGRR